MSLRATEESAAISSFFITANYELLRYWDLIIAWEHISHTIWK